MLTTGLVCRNSENDAEKEKNAENDDEPDARIVDICQKINASVVEYVLIDTSYGSVGVWAVRLADTRRVLQCGECDLQYTGKVILSFVLETS